MKECSTIWAAVRIEKLLGFAIEVHLPNVSPRAMLLCRYAKKGMQPSNFLPQLQNDLYTPTIQKEVSSWIAAIQPSKLCPSIRAREFSVIQSI